MVDNHDGEGNEITPVYSEVTHPSVDGIYTITKCSTQEIFDSAVSYQARDDDIFVVSFPKCGTTWTLNIVDLLRQSLKGSRTSGKHVDSYTFLDHEGKEAVECKASPRLIKSHFYLDMIPWNSNAKYVFVARNVKDSLVSFYHHTVGYEQYYHFKGGQFSTYFQLFLNGKVDFGDYFKMVPEWWQRSKTESNIHFMLYEDMKTDLSSEILKLARFVGDEVHNNLLKNGGENLDKIVQVSSFKQMQTQQQNYVGEADHKFFRKGVIGDWRTMMTSQQEKLINQKIRQTDEIYPGFIKLWDKYHIFTD